MTSGGSRLKVRSGRLTDLAALRRLEQRTFGPREAFSRGQIARLLGNRRARYRLIEVGGRLAAAAVTVIWQSPTQPVGWLYSIAVSPRHRGKGFARRLLADALAWCRHKRVERVMLQVRADNGPAISLYRSFGFRISRSLPDYYGPGADGVEMVVSGQGTGTRGQEKTRGNFPASPCPRVSCLP